MGKGKKGGLMVLAFVVCGLLLWVTGTVIATPYYASETDRQPEVVFNTGLDSQPGADAGAAAEPDDLVAVGKKTFSAKGCTQCHLITSLNVGDPKSTSVIGPDLTNAVTNVPDKYGRSLAEFFNKPQGTMVTVLPGKKLTEQDKAGIVAYLESAAAAANPKTVQ